MNLKHTLLAAATALAATVSMSSFAADLASGEASFQICRTCHGSQGEGQLPLNAPNLTGQPTWYLERQLNNYKQGIRGTHAKDTYGSQMRPMSMTLATDNDVKNVAAYIASLPVQKAAKTLGGDANKGKALYTVCATCHGQKAEGMKALNSPQLANLQDWYMLRQLKNFKEGVRGSHPKDIYGSQMRPMSMTLANEQAMKDVAAYINGLQP